MLKALEKYWPLISLLLLAILLAAFLFWPSMARALTTAMLILSISVAGFFVARRQIHAYRENKIDRAALVRNIFVETAGTLIAMALAAFLIRQVAGTIISFASGAVSILLMVAASVLIGLMAGILVKLTWGKLAKSESKNS